MTAQALGAGLLGEVKVEGLDELLQSLRKLCPTNRAKIGLSAFDRLVEVFGNPPQRYPQNSERSTLHQLTQQPNLGNKSRHPVIEVTGVRPCSGKSQLLYKIIAISILPTTYGEQSIHGKDEAVVVLDLENKFSILKFQQILSSHLCSLKLSLKREDISSMLYSSLQHLHIFRPQSLQSLLATTNSLSTYLYNTHGHFSANRAVGLLALNGLGTFFWQDRLDADEVGVVGSVNERENDMLLVQKYRDIISALRYVQQTLECTILATNWGLAPVQYTAGHPALRPHLPAIWTNFCTLRVVVERNPVSKFRPGLSAEEAMKEGLRRQEALDESGFSCWVNWWGSDGWRDGVRDELNSIEKGGMFCFRIKDGVVITDEGGRNE